MRATISRRPGVRTASAATALVCCAAAAVTSGASPASAAAANNYSTATSVAAFGGMSGLIAAAKSGRRPQCDHPPRQLVQLRRHHQHFQNKYGIKITSENPEGSSQDEINAMVQLKGQSRAPDVLDMGTLFAVKADQAHLLAPYKVTEWSDIPAAQRASDKTGGPTTAGT